MQRNVPDSASTCPDQVRWSAANSWMNRTGRPDPVASAYRRTPSDVMTSVTDAPFCHVAGGGLPHLPDGVADGEERRHVRRAQRVQEVRQLGVEIIGEDIDEPGFRRPRRVNASGREQQMTGPARAHQLDQAGDGRAVIDDAVPYSRDGEARARTGEPDVAGQSQIVAAPDTQAVDHGDGREREVADGGIAAQRDFAVPGGGLPVTALQRGEVR